MDISIINGFLSIRRPSHLTVESEEEEHRKEETGPQRRDGQLDHGRRVGQERQARTCNRHSDVI